MTRVPSSVVAGALAMVPLMVPVVFVVGHVINHSAGICLDCGFGGD